MTVEPETFPNFGLHPDSPEPEELGIEIKLAEGPSFDFGVPVVLRGGYTIDQQFSRISEGAPLTRVLIIVVRRDEPGNWSRLVMDGHNLATRPADPNEPEVAGYSEGGYFNLDLVKFLELDEPGRYWVLASLGDWVSERLEFELTEE